MLRAARRRRRRRHLGLAALALLGPTPADAAELGAADAASGLRQEVDAATRRLRIDWTDENELPPWLTHISEGASQGVGIILGQPKTVNGGTPMVLEDRAWTAKNLLSNGQIAKVVASGTDLAGTGTTEASLVAQVLMEQGITKESIIQEPEATTTAETLWFSLRWLPEGTGKIYIITSEFNMPRALYIFQEVMAHFYRSLDEHYKDSPEWGKAYPKLELVEAPAASFCGSNAELSADSDPNAPLERYSLARRAMDELRYMGDGEVERGLYGPPLGKVQFVWPEQINVSLNPLNEQNYEAAINSAVDLVKSFCKCKAPPEGDGPELEYPYKSKNGPRRDRGGAAGENGSLPGDDATAGAGGPGARSGGSGSYATFSRNTVLMRKEVSEIDASRHHAFERRIGDRHPRANLSAKAVGRRAHRSRTVLAQSHPPWRLSAAALIEVQRHALDSIEEGEGASWTQPPSTVVDWQKVIDECLYPPKPKGIFGSAASRPQLGVPALAVAAIFSRLGRRR